MKQFENGKVELEVGDIVTISHDTTTPLDLDMKVLSFNQDGMILNHGDGDRPATWDIELDGSMDRFADAYFINGKLFLRENIIIPKSQ